MAEPDMDKELPPDPAWTQEDFLHPGGRFPTRPNPFIVHRGSINSSNFNCDDLEIAEATVVQRRGPTTQSNPRMSNASTSYPYGSSPDYFPAFGQRTAANDLPSSSPGVRANDGFAVRGDSGSHLRDSYVHGQLHAKPNVPLSKTHLPLTNYDAGIHHLYKSRSRTDLRAKRRDSPKDPVTSRIREPRSTPSSKKSATRPATSRTSDRNASAFSNDSGGGSTDHRANPYGPSVGEPIAETGYGTSHHPSNPIPLSNRAPVDSSFSRSQRTPRQPVQDERSSKPSTKDRPKASTRYPQATYGSSRSNRRRVYPNEHIGASHDSDPSGSQYTLKIGEETFEARDSWGPRGSRRLPLGMTSEVEGGGKVRYKADSDDEVEKGWFGRKKKKVKKKKSGVFDPSNALKRR